MEQTSTHLSLGIFWINLSSRPDRRSECVRKLSNVCFPSTRVEAISRENVPNLTNTSNQFYFKGIKACSMSHSLALSLFLESDYSFGLILEDDFVFGKTISNSYLSQLIKSMDHAEISFLQIGYLPYGNSLENFFLKPARFILSLSHRLISLIDPRIRDPRHWSLKLRSGTHAYIVDRAAAHFIIDEISKAEKIPLDLFYKLLAKRSCQDKRIVRFSRLFTSQVDQDERSRSDLQIR